MRILFVCTGNTCRSPMAAFLLRTKVKQRGLGWDVESAGLFASQGIPMSAAAVSALESMGIDGSRHQSQAVTRELLEQSDYIFTMTYAHKLELLSRFPEMTPKVHQFGSFVAAGQNGGNQDRGEYDIVDPFGGSTGEYLGCAIQLSDMVDELIAKLAQADDGNS